MGNSNSSELTVATISSPAFLEELVKSDDPLLPDGIARRGAVAWAATRAVTLLACFRMKQLFEGLSTRKEAVEKTGYTSWTAWLSSVDLPVSDGLVRQRCIEIVGYLDQGVNWETIFNIFCYGPTAGSDVLDKIVGPDGQPAAYVDTSKLPGGTVQGLLEAIANIPDPGQSRKLVSEAAGEVQIYAGDALLNDGKLYVNVIFEHPDANETLYIHILNYKERGQPTPVPDSVAHWIAKRLGARML